MIKPVVDLGGGTKWSGKVERLGWGGVGIARSDDGKLILLDSPLALFPGENVLANIKWKARHAEGAITSWITRDGRRCTAECEVAETCGGCSLWGAGEAASELKRQMVGDLLTRQIRDAPEPVWFAAPPDAKRFRIQLHWDGNRLGFAMKKSNSIIPVSNCPMASRAVSNAIPALHASLSSGKLIDGYPRWELDTGFPEGEVTVHPTGNRRLAFKLSGGEWRRTKDLVNYEFETGSISRTIGTFFQACPDWAYSAFSKLFELWNTNGKQLFDVYGGCGFVSFLLRDRFEKLIVVEADPVSAADAARNLGDVNAVVLNSNAADWINGNPVTGGGLVFLDPPRCGLGNAMTKLLCDSDARELVLLGCDGAAFARDIRQLRESFTLASIAAIDLFPNTPHVEFAGRLVR